MNQVVLDAPGALRIVQVPEAVAKTGQALVRLRLAGICGSDLSAYQGTSPVFKYPRILGHELLVDVLECDDRPELVGQRAVVDPMIPCGRCQVCSVGKYNCCINLTVMGVHTDGGMQEISAINSTHLFSVPNILSDAAAVLAEPLSIAYHAIQRSGIEPGGSAVVFGAGTIGLLLAQVLLRVYQCPTIVIDVNVERLKIGEQIGAIAIQGSEESIIASVTHITNSQMASHVFEATGSASCTNMTTAVVRPGGKIILIGWNKGPTKIDTVTLMRKEVDLLGSRNSINAFPTVLRLLSNGVVDADIMITHSFKLTETIAAFQILNAGRQNALKIVIRP